MSGMRVKTQTLGSEGQFFLSVLRGHKLILLEIFVLDCTGLIHELQYFFFYKVFLFQPNFISLIFFTIKKLGF